MYLLCCNFFFFFFFSLKHDPNYPFGKDNAQLGEADQLQAFLDDLEVKLDQVQTFSERHAVIQSQLPRGMKLGKMPVTGRNEDKPPEKVKPSVMMEYAKKNDVKNLEIMLKLGLPVDYRDEDTGNTPLMVACQAGQRQAMFYLVEQGADVNAQNMYGATPLHELIKNKRENLAIWLIKHGADIYLEDKRTYSPYDLALPWFQKDMKKVAADVDITKRHEVKEVTQTTYSLTKNQTEDKPQGVQTAKPIKVFFQNDSYKTVYVEPDWTARTLIEKVCEKLGLENSKQHFQLLEHIKGREKKIETDANVLQTKSKWPLIVGPNANDTDKYCKFVCLPRSDAPAAVVEDYSHLTKN